MSNLAIKKTKRNTYIRNSFLIIAAFSTAFFPRLLDAVGAPSPINFVHFITVPLVLIIVLIDSRSLTKDRVDISHQLLVGLFVLFTVTTISALVNEAGFINVIVEYLLLAEPFMLLVAIISIPMSISKIKLFKNFLLVCASINLVLALIQKPLIDAGLLFAEGFDGTDGAQGVFFVSGAGNYVSSTVSLKFGLYYFLTQQKAPLWLRCLWLIAACIQLIISDSKQIIIASLIAFTILIIRSLVINNRKALIYIVVAIVLGLSFVWALNNVEYFSAFENGIRKTSEWGPGGSAREIKLAPFEIATSHYTSILNWLFGLGPGHSFGRLGGWFLRDYADLLEPLGATVHRASKEGMTAYWNSWIAQESTLYHPFFGWVGIWGDLGLVGLGAYLYLASIVWQNLCFDDLGKFFLLVISVVGLIFTQMEEPGYMLFVAFLIGLRFQEKLLSKN